MQKELCRLKPILITALFIHSGSVHAEATQIEMDAAVSRMSSAAFKIEIFAACGYAKDAEEKSKVMRVAKAVALQKDDLNKKLTPEQFSSAWLRTLDKGLVASMQARAQQEATTDECAKQDNKTTWAFLLQMASQLQAK